MRTDRLDITANSYGLQPVAVKTLLGQDRLDFDLHIWPNKGRPPLLYREKHVALQAADLQRLLDQGVTTLYTRSADAEVYCDHVRTHVIANEAIPVDERYCILKDATRAVLSTALRNGDVDQVLTVSANLGRDMVGVICERQNVLRDLITVMTHDYSTFTHITNVCTCCVVLAEAYGIHDQNKLMEIAQGALLHDLGKCFVPAELLNKQGALTSEEQEVLRQHPQRGFEQVCSRQDLSWGQLMMIYQHHERIDGRGYPVGLVGNEIHEWGRLCAVADIYDAMTRDRPYRRGADLREVQEYMDRAAGRSFDEEMIQCWISTLKQCQL